MRVGFIRGKKLRKSLQVDFKKTTHDGYELDRFGR